VLPLVPTKEERRERENRDRNKITFKASPNNNTNASNRRPLGALPMRGNIPSHVSLVKKPSVNSQGGKALKLLEENGDKDRTRQRT
jgi:hypothetical protein